MAEDINNPLAEWKRIQKEGATSVSDIDKVSDALDEQAREARQIVVKQMGTLTAVDVQRQKDIEKAMAVNAGSWHDKEH